MGRKRKVEQVASDDDDTAPAPVLKRTRGATAKQAQPTAAAARPKRTPGTDASSPSTKVPIKGKSSRSRKKAANNAEDVGTPKAAISSDARPLEVSEASDATASRRNSTVSVEILRRGKKDAVAKVADDKEPHEGVVSDEKSYWLMKAEPESRVEKGKDVKFSIDDLEARQEPEGWDGKPNAHAQPLSGLMALIGVRNMAGEVPWYHNLKLLLSSYIARKNIRSMKKGDLAFFYHSNCKVPGIAGIMEIVREHSVDGEVLSKSLFIG